MIWGAMGVNGLSHLHIVHTGKTVTSNYYVDNILQRELKPAVMRTRSNGRIDQPRLVPYPGCDQRRLVPYTGEAVFMHDGATQHTAAATQNWCTENLPNLSRKTCGLAIRLILIALRTFGVYWTARLTKTPAPRLWCSYVCSRPGGPYLHNTSLLSYTLCPREFTML